MKRSLSYGNHLRKEEKMKNIIISLLIAAFVIGAFAACAPDDSPAGLIKQAEKIVEKGEKLKTEFLEFLSSNPSDLEKAEAKAESMAEEGQKLEADLQVIWDKMENLGEDAFTEEQKEKIGELRGRVE